MEIAYMVAGGLFLAFVGGAVGYGLGYGVGTWGTIEWMARRRGR
jgi:hypothetical protein